VLALHFLHQRKISVEHIPFIPVLHFNTRTFPPPPPLLPAVGRFPHYPALSKGRLEPLYALLQRHSRSFVPRAQISGQHPTPFPSVCFFFFLSPLTFSAPSCFVFLIGRASCPGAPVNHVFRSLRVRPSRVALVLVPGRPPSDNVQLFFCSRRYRRRN